VSWVLLLIEDDKEIQDLLGRVLAARGFRIMLASNGAEAIELTRRSATRPDVILLDLMMPVMDGEGFLREQPHVPLLAGVPVIIVSATAEVPDPLPATVYKVLAKPARLPDLLMLISDLVASPVMGVRAYRTDPSMATVTPPTSIPPIAAPPEPAMAAAPPAMAAAADAPSAAPAAEEPPVASAAPAAEAVGEPPKDGTPEGMT
jgi:CheY-like chemotaxis protein